MLSWEVDGITYAGTVPSIAILVDSMNVWDPTGNWSLNETSIVIEGGHEGGVYGQLNVLDVDTGTRSVLGYDARFVPMGSAFNLSIGIHDLIVDYGTCQDSFTIDVVGQGCNSCTPATIENVIIEKATCNQETGSININIVGDLNDYDFEWAPDNGTVGSTDNIRTNLIAGGYRITIRNKADENCFIEEFVIIENGALPDATCEIGPADCVGATGTATLNPSDFTYLWSDGGSGATRTDLLAGIYYVTFSDPATPECPNVKLIEILEINELAATLNVEQHPSCGASNGIVSIIATGGSGDYSFSFPSGADRQSGLSTGIYEVNIRDEQSGCELLFPFLLESRETVETLSILNTNDVTCLDATDGAVNFEITYSNEFLFPADTVITDGFNQYTNGQLGVGDYFIYIQDVTGCITSSAPFTIAAPASLDLAIFRSTDCSEPLFIEVEPIDTTLVLRYDWADIAGADNAPIRNDLASGIYELTVFDAQNCSTSVSIELPECCEPPIVQNTNIIAADCGVDNGQVEILIDGSIEDYTFAYAPNLGVTGATNNSRDSLPVGNYLVTISLAEDSSCFDTLTIAIPEETNVSYIIDSNISSASCGLSNGTVELLVSGDNTLYTYSYEPNEGTVGATPNLRANLPAGTYTITVALISNPSCEETQTIIVPEDLAASYITDSNIGTASCGLLNGTVELLVVGDNTLYTYNYEPNEGTAGATPNLRANLPAGTYTVTVALASNPACEETQTIVVPEDPTTTYITDSNITTASCGLENGTVELLVEGDHTLYTYSYAPEVGTAGATPNIQENVPAGTYTVRVFLTDNPICGETQTIVVPEDDIVSYIMDSNITSASCGLANGRVELLVSGDNALYTYSYEPNEGTVGATPNIQTNLPAGNYNVTVALNGSDCNEVIDFVVPEEDAATFVLDTIVTPSECNSSNGSIEVLVDGDLTDYSFTYDPNLGTIGASTNIMESLPAGDYSVTIRLNSAGACSQTINFSITEPSVDIVNNTIVLPADCGSNNGMVTLEVNGSVEDFTYAWPTDAGIEGAQPNSRTELSSGTYSVTITPIADLTCGQIIEVGVPSGNTNTNPVIDNVVINPTCGIANGMVDLTLSSDPSNYRFEWQPNLGVFGNTQNIRNELPSGDYEIFITDLRDTVCVTSISVNLVNEELVANAITNASSCSGSTDGSIRLSPTTFTYTWEDGFVGSDRFNILAGDYLVTITDPTTPDCASPMTVTLSTDNIFIATAMIDSQPTCELNDGSVTISFEGGSGDYTYSWESLNNINNNLPPGIHSVTVSDNISGCESIVDFALADPQIAGLCDAEDCDLSVGIDTIAIQTTNCSELIEVCFDYPLDNNLLELSIDGFVVPIDTNDICQTDIGTTGFSTLINIGRHEAIILDSNTGCADSILVMLNCVFTDTTNITFVPGQLDTLCFSTDELTGEVASIMIGCLQNDIAIVEVVNDTCVVVEAFEPGIDTACVIICDSFGICDTTYLDIFIETLEFVDSLVIREVGEICIDATALGSVGEITQIEIQQIIADSIKPVVAYEIDTVNNCIIYTANVIGVDSSLVIFCDDASLCDTIPFTINVMNDEPDRLSDTLFINETVIYCFDDQIFPGEITTFENICIEQSGEHVDFFLNPLTNCVEYTGIDLGRDTACIILCDDQGICDTAFFDALVVEFKELPTAINDLDTTTIGTPVVIDILSNDTPFGVLEDGISIVELPLYGNANLNLDGSITYITDEFCARFDEFTYSICNAIGCDTATVEIWIECVDIVIFTAVSPNRDTYNDFFFISGIEEFPESRLQIYNRWGERVFEEIGYDNDWAGTWKGNKELPDGAYFYTLELNDEDQRFFSGFLELHR